MIEAEASRLRNIDIDVMRTWFDTPRDAGEIRNPHPEPAVSAATRANARASAVLVLVRAGAQPSLILTRRQYNIRFGGDVCFPGGHIDAVDRSAIDAALREAEEEIGLAPDDVEVLGQLPDYYSQSGYQITPVVGVVEESVRLLANPQEVADIIPVPLDLVLDPARYSLTQYATRGHIAFHHGPVRVSGPTVSVMIGLLERLARRD